MQYFQNSLFGVSEPPQQTPCGLLMTSKLLILQWNCMSLLHLLSHSVAQPEHTFVSFVCASDILRQQIMTFSHFDIIPNQIEPNRKVANLCYCLADRLLFQRLTASMAAALLACHLYLLAIYKYMCRQMVPAKYVHSK